MGVCPVPDLLWLDHVDFLDLFAQNRHEFSGELAVDRAEIVLCARGGMREDNNSFALERGAGGGDTRLEGLQEVEQGSRIAAGQREQTSSGESETQSRASRP